MRRTSLKRKKAMPVSSIRQFQTKKAKKRYGWVKGRYVATRAEWEVILRTKLGPCRVCGATLRPSLHHLVGKDNFGDDVIENLIPLCGSGTTGCHGIYESHHSGESMDGIRREWEEVADTIRRTLLDEEIRYADRKAGDTYLERSYPLIV